MRKTTLILLLCLSGLVHAQTDLSGRIYANPNVMPTEMEKDMASLEHKIDSLRQNGYAAFEQKKGRKPTAEEKAEIDEKMKEARKMMESLKKAITTRVEVEFKDQQNMVMRMKMHVDDNALKLAGVPWIKRKALKAATAIAPSSEKAKYIQKGNLIIVQDEEEPDTLRLSDDGKYIYGKIDKKQKFKLTRTK